MTGDDSADSESSLTALVSSPGRHLARCWWSFDSQVGKARQFATFNGTGCTHHYSNNLSRTAFVIGKPHLIDSRRLWWSHQLYSSSSHQNCLILNSGTGRCRLSWTASLRLGCHLAVKCQIASCHPDSAPKSTALRRELHFLSWRAKTRAERFVPYNRSKLQLRHRSVAAWFRILGRSFGFFASCRSSYRGANSRLFQLSWKCRFRQFLACLLFAKSRLHTRLECPSQ